jgi:hypothetical protein
VVLVEVVRKPYLASMVPVIVNAILNEHQIIVDIVAFVNKGDFPRSRLGEKQRGKLLAGWVTRKMRTLAQFSIREVDPLAVGETSSGGGDVADPRVSMVSARSSGVPPGATSSLRNVEQAPRIMEHEEFEQQVVDMAHMAPEQHPSFGGQPQQPIAGYQGHDGQADTSFTGHQVAAAQPSSGYDLPDFDQFGTSDNQPPQVGPKPLTVSNPTEGQAPPKIRLPGVDGRESLDFWSKDKEEEEDSWEADAIMHMNLTGEIQSPR